MAEPLETPSEVEGELLGRIADEVAERIRRGERPDLSDYAKQNPRIAQLILEGLPLLEMIGRRSESAPAPAPAIPDKLGSFEIVRLIGRGGMAAVYEAREPALGRSVALKVLAASITADESAVERFRREARAVALLHHTNIVPVFGVGEAEGAHFFAMQLIRGRSLDQLQKDEGGRIKDEASTSDLHPSSFILHPFWGARVALQVAEALAHAHGHGVVHRDVKPSNVLVDESGTAWLTDFGLAKVRGLGDLTRDGEVVGTLRFMAPECFRGEADARSDVYSLGMTLYELVTRRPAFSESDRGRLLWQVAREEPPRPRSVDRRIPRDLETIILKAIAKEPARRYVTARDLADDLRHFLDGYPIAARRPPMWELAGRWCRRNPLPAALIAGIFLLLGATAIGASLTALRLNEQKHQISANLERAEKAEGDARTAGDREAEAKRAALRRAWEGMLTEAALVRGNSNAGRRTKALARLEEAAALLPEIPHDSADVRRLRDLVTTVLFTPDLVAGPTWEREVIEDRLLGFDDTGRYAVGNRATGDIRIFRGPDQPPEWSVHADLNGELFSHAVFSPDSRYLAVFFRQSLSTPLRLALWHIGTAAPALQLPDAASVAFSPDSRLVACIRGDRYVEIRRLDAGVGPPVGPANLRALYFAFAPGGDRYACLSTASRVLVRGTASHDTLSSFPAPEGTATGLAWLPDGGRIVVPSTASLHVCDAQSGAVLQRLTCAAGFSRPSSVSCSGEWLAAVGDDGLLRVWDAGVGGEPSVTAGIALSPAIRHVTFVGPDLMAHQLSGWQRFRFEPAGEYRRLGGSHKHELMPAVIPADGRWLAVARSAGSGKELSVCLWDLVAGTTTNVPTGPGPVDALLADPDGSALYVLGVEDGSARLRRWPISGEAKSPSQLRVGAPADVPLPPVQDFLPRGSLTISPDGRFVALAGVVTLSESKSHLKGADEPGSPERTYRPAFVTTSLADLKLGKWPSPPTAMYPMQFVHTYPPPKRTGTFRLAVSPDARWLSMAQSDAPVSMKSESAKSVFWDLSGSAPTAADARYSDGLSRQVAFSPDGRWFVEGSRSEYCVRTPGTWEIVARIAGDSSGRRSSPAAFSPDGRLLAVVRSRREVTLLQTGTWQEVATLPLRQDDVLHWMSFTADGRLFGASSVAIHIWDLGRIRAKWRELGVDLDQ